MKKNFKYFYSIYDIHYFVKLTMQVIIYAQRTHYIVIYFSKYKHTGAVAWFSG